MGARPLGGSRGPISAGAERRVQEQSWKNAAISYSNLSGLLLTLGRVPEAVATARRSVDFADRSGDQFQRTVNRATEADRQRVKERGYQYCDLLLTQGSAAEARRRAAQTIEIAKRNNWLLAIALDHLTLARADDSTHITPAIDGFRRAGQIQYLPLGLLARGTQRDLDEVLKIATRSGMKLHLTDAHLAQARLYLREGRRDDARTHFDKADHLVTETGYHRRDPELAELRTELEG